MVRILLENARPKNPIRSRGERLGDAESTIPTSLGGGGPDMRAEGGRDRRSLRQKGLIRGIQARRMGPDQGATLDSEILSEKFRLTCNDHLFTGEL